MFFSFFRAGVLLVGSDLALRAGRDAASSIGALEPPSPTALVSKVADAAFAFGLLLKTAESVGLVALSIFGTRVRPCCSVPDATAEVRVGSGLSSVSQR